MVARSAPPRDVAFIHAVDDDAQPAPKSRAQGFEALAGLCTLLWLASMVAGVVIDQSALLPLPPATANELERAGPEDAAKWRNVYEQLSQRLPDPSPLELGDVWITRRSMVCGLVNHRIGENDHMVPFYTVNLVPILKYDSDFGFFRFWSRCKRDRWIELHRGSDKSGFCATRRGARSWYGGARCSSPTNGFGDPT